MRLPSNFLSFITEDMHITTTNSEKCEPSFSSTSSQNLKENISLLSSIEEPYPIRYIPVYESLFSSSFYCRSSNLDIKKPKYTLTRKDIISLNSFEKNSLYNSKKITNHYPSSQILPVVSISGDYVQIDDFKVNLKAYPLCLKLIKTFLKSKNNLTVSKEDLIRNVYLEESYSRISESTLVCFQSSLHQLIARTKNLIGELISTYYRIDWFHYDNDTQLWSLYMFGLEFIKDKNKVLVQSLEYH